MKSVDTNVSLPRVEEGVLEYWSKEDIFTRSMDEHVPLDFSSEKSENPREP